MSTNVTLGQTVEYISTKGLRKAAIVIATSESLTEGTALSVQYPLDAEQEQVNLLVLSASGNHGPRYQVPSEAAVSGNEDFANGGFYRVV